MWAPLRPETEHITIHSYRAQDLRCLLWDTAITAEAVTVLAELLLSQRMHEGKNVWSVAMSPDDSLLVSRKRYTEQPDTVQR